MMDGDYVDNRNAMLKYIRPPVWQVLFTATFFPLSALYLLWVMIKKISAGNASTFELVLFAVFIPAYCFFAFLPFMDYRKTVKSLTSSNSLDEAAADFSSAQPFFQDHIRFGDRYLFGGNCCSVLRYTDIVKVYQSVYKQKRRERSRTLRAVDRTGKNWDICKLIPHSRFSDERNAELEARESEIISFLLSKNGTITVEE
ncbi:MAG: hypothetical protein IJT02_02555 [Synergistaceae bacterium]|nr:hypothetical protein [Synergistaceae bacterium]